MREAGLLLTINTDDPAMLDLDLGREYRGVAEAHHLDVAELSQIAVEGVASTWLDESDRNALTDEFNAVLLETAPGGVNGPGAATPGPCTAPEGASRTGVNR